MGENPGKGIVVAKSRMFPGRSGRDREEGKGDDADEARGNGMCWKRMGGRGVGGTRVG